MRCNPPFIRSSSCTDAQSADVRRGKAAGFEDYLTMLLLVWPGSWRPFEPLLGA